MNVLILASPGSFHGNQRITIGILAAVFMYSGFTFS